MQSISVFLDITKVASVSRNQGVRHVMYIYFASSLGKA